MYERLANRLALRLDAASGNSPYVETSRAVSMGDDNAVEYDVVVVKMNAGTLYVQCQGSNDLENWVSFAILLQPTAEGYYPSAVVSDFGLAYARLRYVFASASDGDYCVFATGLKTFAN